MQGLAIFDLDGTLVDTAPDLVDTCNVVLSRRGVPTIQPERLRVHIGMGAKAMIAASLQESGVTLGDDELEAVHREYLTHYGERIARDSRPFPELLAALDTIAAADVAAAVCTNKREALATQLLAELGLLDRFVFVAGFDTFAVSKPDPGHLLATISAAGGVPDHAVYVGDSRIDRETAQAARVPFVGLTYGYSDVPMTELAPDRLLGRGEDVGAAILSLLATSSQQR
ncbi:HAD hydrolase-like protein [Acuticoccus sp.]|uniref:HAD hydrolase-like protein n=1 Tax=Acuticoccus sp. TaxID=1904378 RepID=UPI003B51590B